MGEKEDAINLAVLEDRLKRVQETQKEHKEEIEELKGHVSDLKSNNVKIELHVTQIFEKLNDIKDVLDKKSKHWKEIVYVIFGCSLTGLATYFATIASMHH